MARTILESAQRSLTTLRRTAARVGPRTLAKVVWRVAAVLLFLELVYLVAGNLVLRSQIIQRAVGAAQGFHLDFGKAYTLVPGRVHVRDFSLRIEDYNVQFEVALDRAQLDIALGQLPFKKFRVTRLDAEGTRFHMRHKLVSVGDDAERVAAFPKIRDFADPPLYVGIQPPPIPDAEYDLWQVKIENVTARVRELWVMEYRFVGAGEARGSFVVKPARWVQVEPAKLRLDDGRLTLGSHLVAEHLRGHITCDIPDMHVQETSGVQVFRDISTTLSLALEGGELDFLRAYLARYGSVSYAGHADWRIDANVQRGVVQPGTSIVLRATPLQLRAGSFAAASDLRLSLERPAPDRLLPGSRGDELWLSFQAPRIALERTESDAAPPRLEAVVGSLELHAADLKGEMSLGPARLLVGKALAPALGWFSRDSWRLAGSAQARLELARTQQGAISGSARLDAHRLALAHGKKHSEPLDVTAVTDRLQLDPEAGSARGEVALTARPLRSLLPLLMSAPLDDVAGTALDLETLQARIALQLEQGSLRLRVIDATSGRLRVRGYLDQRSRKSLGAFLLSSGPLHVGVTLRNGETEVSPFVGADWLAATWPRLSGTASGPGAG
jgi:hypothetical protein